MTTHAPTSGRAAWPLAGWLVVAVLYLGVARLGQLVAIPPGDVTAGWPAAGLALAAILILGRHLWPGLWLGAFLAQAWSLGERADSFSLGLSATALGMGAGAALQAMLGAVLLHRYVGPRFLDEAAKVLEFTVVALAAGLVGAAINVLSLFLGDFLLEGTFLSTLGRWWVGDTVGVILVTPLVLTWIRLPPFCQKPRQLAEALFLLAILVGFCELLFGGWLPPGWSRPYLLLPLLLWAVWRLGRPGVTAAIVVVAAIAFSDTAGGQGHFFRETPGLYGPLLSLQGFIGVITVTSLVLAAVFSEHQRAEERLRTSESHWRQLVETCPDIIISVNRDGTILFVNHTVPGLSVAQTIGTRAFDYVPPASQDRLRQIFDQVFQNGDSFSYEIAGTGPHGTLSWYSTRISPIRQNGQIVAAIMIVTDITAHKRAEEALKDSEALYHSLVENLPLQIYRKDRQGRLIFANQRFCDLRGQTLEQLLGKTVFDFHAEPLARKYTADDQKVMQTEQVFHEVEEHVDGQGHQLHVEVIKTPVRNSQGQVVGIQGLFWDVTERKRLEEAEEIRRLNDELEERVRQRTSQLEAANQELEAFSYSVSHDLRAPLRSIAGFSSILVKDCAAQLSAEALRYLHKVRQNAQQMGQLIDDLLTFSRLGRKPLTKQPLALAPIVRAVLDSLRAEGEGRQLEIVMGDLPLCLGDPALLKQVFANLIGNALKYSRPRDPAVIEIGCRQGSHLGELVYYVKDNGVGFDMRYGGKLFGVFQRLHRAEEYEGTGVGLAIVQRIIHRHGGRIWAEGVVNQGATFYFTLEGCVP